MDTVLIPIEHESKLNGFHLDTISHIATVNNFRVGLVHNYLPQSQCQFPKSRTFALERMKAVFSNPQFERLPHRCFVREGRLDKVIGRLEKQSHSKLIVFPVRNDVDTLVNIIQRTDTTVYALPEKSVEKAGIQTAVFLCDTGELNKDDLKRILSINNVLRHTWKILIVSPVQYALSPFVSSLFKRYKVQVYHHHVDSLGSDGTLNFILHIEPDCLVMKNARVLTRKKKNNPDFLREVLAKNIPVISF